MAIQSLEFWFKFDRTKFFSNFYTIINYLTRYIDSQNNKRLLILLLLLYLLLTWGSDTDDSPLVPMVTSWYLDPDTSALLRRYSRKTFRPSYKTARMKTMIQAPTIPTTHYKTFKLEYHSGLFPFITVTMLINRIESKHWWEKGLTCYWLGLNPLK